MTASLVRSVCNQIQDMKLKSFPGENVAKMGEKISELVQKIESSGEAPPDLLFLVTKPFTTGTQETFHTYAQQIYTSVIDRTFKHGKQGYVEIITKMNTFYQNLVQSNDYEPARGGKKDQDMATLQGMIAKLQGEVSKLSSSKGNNGNNSSGTTNTGKKKACFECGSEDHMVKDCPVKAAKKKSGANNNSSKPPLEEWRKKPPSQGESHTKTVNGLSYKWCGKC